MSSLLEKCGKLTRNYLGAASEDALYLMRAPFFKPTEPVTKLKPV